MKPLTPEKMPPSIWILLSGKDGNRYQDYEQVLVRIDSPISRESSSDLLPPLEEDQVFLKRKDLLNRNAFLFQFIEENEVEQLYESYFSNPVINSKAVLNEIAAEIEKKTDKSASVNVKELIQAELGIGTIQKIVGTIKFEQLPPIQKFIQFQRRMIEDNEVVLGLEFENDKSDELARFDELIKAVRAYGIVLPDSGSIEAKRRQLGLKDIGQIIDDLRVAANKHVIISAVFSIEVDTLDENSYLMKYVHPISSRLPQQQLTLVVRVPKEKLKGEWGREFKRGQPIQTNVYGLVLRAPNLSEEIENWEIGIFPIAIFS
ncbi:MAG: hypothetical protein HC827_17560 [Cyanobacteria bacterium RM1_2_2]|nr:hypothetical protein [Cyanobacteria bacterium RM1_2_2]